MVVWGRGKRERGGWVWEEEEEEVVEADTQVFLLPGFLSGPLLPSNANVTHTAAA